MKLRRSKALVWLHGFVLFVVIALALYGIARGQAQGVSAQPRAAANAHARAAASSAVFHAPVAHITWTRQDFRQAMPRTRWWIRQACSKVQ